MNKKKLFSYKSPVRIDDLNFGNHLCHGRVLNFLHNTRALFLKQYDLSEINCFGFGLIMLNVNIEYVNQCLFDDLLEITIYLEKFTKATISLSYEIYNHSSNKLATSASTKIGFLNLEKGKLAKPPEKFKKLIHSIC